MATPLVPLSSLTGSTYPAATGSALVPLEELRQLPPPHQAQLRFLDPASTRAVYAAASDRDILSGDDGWGTLLLSGDNVLVVGETAEWCLHWHHDGVTTFAEGIAWERRAPGQRW